ncbi:MAG: transcription antitermination factor NusB [Eggerthellaceae bacterium]|nr:transcription antitermination factor NusB [Eggerthellaceae bacterium]
MSAKRHERTSARRCALQVLYQSEILEESAPAIAAGEKHIDEEGILGEYAYVLLAGIEEHREQIDGYLKDTSENWALERMPIVDRSILRLAVFEMLYVEDVPLSVSINEAVELAKDFGGEDESPRFVNGVLGRIAKTFEEDGHEE